MSYRVNISIPDSLHERLSRFKDQLNISKICQEAINHVVRIEEIKNEKASDMDSLVERLKEEELQYAKKFIEEGLEFGIKDAYGLSLEDLLNISRFRSDVYPYEIEGSAPFLPSEETIEALEEFVQREHFSDKKYIQMDQTPGVGYRIVPAKYFIRGWVEGVLNVWDQAKEYLVGFEEEAEEERTQKMMHSIDEESEEKIQKLFNSIDKTKLT